MIPWLHVGAPIVAARPARTPGISLFTVALVTLAASCASKESAPAPEPTPAPTAPVVSPQVAEPPEVQRWAELAEQLAAALGRAGKNCREVAKTVGGFVERHEAELEATSRAVMAWEATARPYVVRNFYKRIFPALSVRIDAGIRCKDDRKATEAFDRFFAASGLDQR